MGQLSAGPSLGLSKILALVMPLTYLHLLGVPCAGFSNCCLETISGSYN